MARAAGFLLLVVLCLGGSTVKAETYICPPCGGTCDTLVFSTAGTCDGCGMTLIATSKIRDVAIIVFEGVELLDFTGPYEAFYAARGLFRVSTVARNTGLLSSNAGLEMKPTYAFADCPAPDIVVIPGGHIRSVIEDSSAMAFIRKSLKSAEVVMSVCNGALVLAELEVLDGLTVTTHQSAMRSLRQRAPKATVVDDRKWVDNGRVITAAGVSSGIDATLHVIGRLHGDDVERDVAEYLEFSPRAE